MAIACLVLGGCSPFVGWECTPSPWTYEHWVDDTVTGRVDASVRRGCDDFPDDETDYRVIGQRPNGAQELLFEGSLEHWEARHSIAQLADGTAVITVFDTSCWPAGEHFTCARIPVRFP